MNARAVIRTSFYRPDDKGTNRLVRTEHTDDILSVPLLTARLTAALVRWPDAVIECATEQINVGGWKAYRDVYTVSIVEKP